MENKNILNIAIVLTVGVILAGSLLMPVISAYGDETLTVHNTGAYFTTSDENEHTLVINATTITYDGKPCIYPDMELYGSATLMVGPDWFLRIAKLTTPAGAIEYIITGPPQQYNRVGTSEEGDCVVTINGSDISAVCGERTVTRTGMEYTISDRGNWVLSHDPYVLENTQFVAAIRNVSNIDVLEIVRGTINDPDNYTTTMCRTWYFSQQVTGTLTDSDYTVSLATVNGPLKKLNEITQTATVNFEGVGDVTRTITIDYILVPETITYNNPDYVGYSGLIYAIPVMVIIALLMVAVGGLFLRRSD